MTAQRQLEVSEIGGGRPSSLSGVETQKRSAADVCLRTWSSASGRAASVGVGVINAAFHRLSLFAEGKWMKIRAGGVLTRSKT